MNHVQIVAHIRKTDRIVLDFMKRKSSRRIMDEAPNEVEGIKRLLSSAHIVGGVMR